jgi:hypothetical protein
MTTRVMGSISRLRLTGQSTRKHVWTTLRRLVQVACLNTTLRQTTNASVIPQILASVPKGWAHLIVAPGRVEPRTLPYRGLLMTIFRMTICQQTCPHVCAEHKSQDGPCKISAARNAHVDREKQDHVRRNVVLTSEGAGSLLRLALLSVDMLQIPSKPDRDVWSVGESRSRRNRVEVCGRSLGSPPWPDLRL